MQRPCSRRVLAAGDHMLVEQCTCSAVHVTIGAVTLRIDPQALSSLAMTLQDAVLALVGRQLQRAGTARAHANDEAVCVRGDDEALS